MGSARDDESSKIEQDICSKHRMVRRRYVQGLIEGGEMRGQDG